MNLRLVSILFHSPANRGLTLPLARLNSPCPPCPDDVSLPSNDSMPVVLPEWRAGASLLPKDSPVAVCAARVPAANPVIQVVLESDDEDGTLEIRALDVSGGGNILGVPRPCTISFEGTSYASFELSLTRTRFTEVALHDDIWQWQWREPGEPWEDLERTQHRVCVTLQPPNSPWGIEPGQQLPWIEALELAARLASGARDVDDAASRITRAVFALGQAAGEHPQFTYLSASFTDESDNFDCASFLAALAGCQSLPTVVDCSDAAALVSSFANILGAHLIQAHLDALFVTRPVCLVGQTEFAPITFGFHEVAWNGPGSSAGRVWDACLLISRGSDPDVAPHPGVNSTGFQFGEFKEKQYRWRLAARDNPGFDTPALRTANRVLGSVHPRPADELGPPHPVIRSDWFYWNLQTIPPADPFWSILRITLIPLDTALFAVDSMWLAGSTKVQVKAESRLSAADAQARLALRRTKIATPLTAVPLGDAGFANASGTYLIFARGNLLVEVRIAGPLERPLDEAAHTIDTVLTDQNLTLPKNVIGSPAPVDISTLLNTGPDGKVWYRVYSTEGQVRVRDGKIVYLGDRLGPQELTLFIHDGPNITRIIHTIDVQ